MEQLAIEMSTRRGSLALRQAGRLTAAYAWDQGERRQQHLFSALPDFLRDAGTAPAALNEIIVGVGPGSFAGIRVALAAAHGLAMPGGVPVYGLASPAALAREACPAEGAAEIVVVGDARREQYWMAIYRWAPPALWPTLAPTLIPVGELAARLPPAARVVTPDGARIGPALEGLLADRDALIIPAGNGPGAETLGELADAFRRQGLALDAPQPLYLHPAVVAPARR